MNRIPQSKGGGNKKTSPKATDNNRYAGSFVKRNRRRIIVGREDKSALNNTYHPQAASIVPAPTRFHIEKINLANISRIQGRIIPSFSWDSPERFLKDGFGYIALDQERVCAVAFSAAVSSDQIDIGVETHENYRRKGLAAILTNCMCDTIVKTGKTPAWAHSISNKGSMNTALKCGFVQDRINLVVSKSMRER